MKINFICQLILLTSTSIILGVFIVMLLFYNRLLSALQDWENVSTEWISTMEKQRMHNSVFSHKIISEISTNQVNSILAHQKNFIDQYKQTINKNRFKKYIIEQLFTQTFAMRQLFQKFMDGRYKRFFIFYKVNNQEFNEQILIKIENENAQYLTCSYYDYIQKQCEDAVYSEQIKNNLFVDLYFERNRRKYNELLPKQKQFLEINEDFSFLPRTIYRDAKKNQLFNVIYIYNADDTSFMAGNPSLTDDFSQSDYLDCLGNDFLEPWDPRCRMWYQYAQAHKGFHFYEPYVDSTNFQVIMTLSTQIRDINDKFLSVLSVDFGIDNLINSVYSQQDKSESGAYYQYNVLLHEINSQYCQQYILIQYKFTYVIINQVFYHKDFDNKSGELKSWDQIEFSNQYNFTEQERLDFQQQVNDTIEFIKLKNYSIQDYRNIDPMFQSWSRNGEKFFSLVYPIRMSTDVNVLKNDERQSYSDSILLTAKVSKDYRDQFKLFKVFDNNTLIIPFIVESVLLGLFIIFFLIHYGIIQIKQVYIPIYLLTQFLQKTLKKQLLSACYQRNISKYDSNATEQSQSPNKRNQSPLQLRHRISQQSKITTRTYVQDSPLKLHLKAKALSTGFRYQIDSPKIAQNNIRNSSPKRSYISQLTNNGYRQNNNGFNTQFDSGEKIVQNQKYQNDQVNSPTQRLIQKQRKQINLYQIEYNLTNTTEGDEEIQKEQSPVTSKLLQNLINLAAENTDRYETTKICSPLSLYTDANKNILQMTPLNNYLNSNQTEINNDFKLNNDNDDQQNDIQLNNDIQQNSNQQLNKIMQQIDEQKQNNKFQLNTKYQSSENNLQSNFFISSDNNLQNLNLQQSIERNGKLNSNGYNKQNKNYLQVNETKNIDQLNENIINHYYQPNNKTFQQNNEPIQIKNNLFINESNQPKLTKKNLDIVDELEKINRQQSSSTIQNTNKKHTLTISHTKNENNKSKDNLILNKNNVSFMRDEKSFSIAPSIRMTKTSISSTNLTKDEAREENIGQIYPMFKEMAVIKETFEKLESVINYAISNSQTHQNFTQSLFHFANAKQTFQKISNINGMNRCYFNLGTLSLILGNYEQSIEEFYASIIISLQSYGIDSLQEFIDQLNKGRFYQSDDQIFLFSKKLFSISYAYKRQAFEQFENDLNYPLKFGQPQILMIQKSLQYLQLVARIIQFKPDLFKIIFRLMILLEFAELYLLSNNLYLVEQYINEFDLNIENLQQFESCTKLLFPIHKSETFKKNNQLAFMRKKRISIGQLPILMEVDEQNNEQIINAIMLKSYFITGQISFQKGQLIYASEIFTSCIEEGKFYDPYYRKCSLNYLNKIFLQQSIYSPQVEKMINHFENVDQPCDFIFLLDESNQLSRSTQTGILQNLWESNFFKKEQDRFCFLSYGEYINAIQNMTNIPDNKRWNICIESFQKPPKQLDTSFNQTDYFISVQVNTFQKNISLSDALIAALLTANQPNQDINNILINQCPRKTVIISFSFKKNGIDDLTYYNIFSKDQQEFIQHNLQIKPDVYLFSQQFNVSSENILDLMNSEQKSSDSDEYQESAYENFYIQSNERIFVQQLFQSRCFQNNSKHSLFLSFISNDS